MCTSCNKKDNIEHMYYECQKIKIFWKLIKNWWKLNMLDEIDISLKSLVVGLQGIKYFEHNYFILHVKWFIYKEFIAEQKLCFFKFMVYFKRALIVERERFIAKNKQNIFHRQFNKLSHFIE